MFYPFYFRKISRAASILQIKVWNRQVLFTLWCFHVTLKAFSNRKLLKPLLQQELLNIWYCQFNADISIQTVQCRELNVESSMQRVQYRESNTESPMQRLQCRAFINSGCFFFIVVAILRIAIIRCTFLFLTSLASDWFSVFD